METTFETAKSNPGYHTPTQSDTYAVSLFQEAAHLLGPFPFISSSSKAQRCDWGAASEESTPSLLPSLGSPGGESTATTLPLHLSLLYDDDPDPSIADESSTIVGEDAVTVVEALPVCPRLPTAHLPPSSSTPANLTRRTPSPAPSVPHPRLPIPLLQ